MRGSRSITGRSSGIPSKVPGPGLTWICASGNHGSTRTVSSWPNGTAGWSAERGSGLGRALTLVGLRYLRGRGLSQVMLYVDETNSAAIGLYESLGFTHWDTDVMYSAPGLAAN